MSFGKDLVKGIIRSAVNQLGRDSGRVVSNQLYGDAHAIPHRSVNGGGSLGSETIIGEPRDEKFEKLPQSPMWKTCAIIVLAFFFNIIGAICLIVAGRSKMAQSNHVKGLHIYSRPTYVPDSRYKEGVRYTGDILYRDKVMLEADEDETRQNEICANTYLYAGIGILLFYVIIFIIQ